MLRSHRGIIIAVVAWLIAAPTLWLLIADLVSVSRSYERHATEASEYYAGEAEREIGQACPRLAPELQNDCVGKAETSARENQRREQELAAQKVTAWWTQIMGGAALIGMALSAIGVALVWTTFREQRRATNLAKEEADRARNDAAESAANAKAALAIAARNADSAEKQVELSAETAKRELRAYVLCDETVTNMTGTLEGVLVSYDIDIHWKNSGSTPATSMKFFVGTINTNCGIPREFRYIEDNAVESETKALGPGGIAVMTITMPIDAMRIPQGFESYFYSWVEYDDAFQEKRRRSEVCYKLIVGEPVPTRDTRVQILNAGPFNGMDDGCHMPLQTKGQSKN